MADRITEEDLELLGELGVDTAPEDKGGRTPREQRIIAGFEEIERFFVENGRVPRHGADRDIFERLYAVRLDRIRGSEECLKVLAGLDKHSLLNDAAPVATTATGAVGGAAGGAGEPSDEDLLAELGVNGPSAGDVKELVHVRSHEQRRAAEEIASRHRCGDFERFKPIFEEVQRDLDAGMRRAGRFKKDGPIVRGDLFILSGQKALVAEVGKEFETGFDRTDARLRVIYDNGTESNLLLRSLQRALYKNEDGRQIGPKGPGPLFSGEEEADDIRSGTIYVLRSLSDHPFVAKHRDIVHKIGVTGGDVKRRLANASMDPTFLLAEVEVVAEYRLANISRSALEAMLHRFFGDARLDLAMKDRFNFEVGAKEWFLVPLAVIDEVIQKILDGTIDGFRYDPGSARLVEV